MEKILGMSTVSPKSQVTIPKRVRERFKIKEGDSVIFCEDGGKLVLRGEGE